MMLTLGKAYSMYPVAQIVFFRSAFALIPVLIWLLLRGDFPRALHTKRFGGHLFRSLAGVGSMFCIFTAYALLPLADATAIGYASPLMIVVLASVFLGERMTALRWGAVCVGFAGVLMMLWEHLGQGGGAQAADHPRSAAGAMFMLAAAFLIAIAMLQTRRLTKTEDTGAITFYFQSTTTVASGLVIVAAALWPGGGAARRPRAGAGLGRAGGRGLGAAGRHRPARRRRPDPHDAGLSLRRRLGAGDVRLFLAPVRGGHRFRHLRRRADHGGSGRRRDRHFCWAGSRLAGKPTSGGPPRVTIAFVIPNKIGYSLKQGD